MSLLYQSLSGLRTIDPSEVATNQRITLITPEGMVNVSWGTLFNKVSDPLVARIATLEAGGGTGGGENGLPSIWPTPRTLTLSGAVSGSVAMDGSQNVSMSTLIADGSLTLAKVANLSTRLNTLDSDIGKTWSTGSVTGNSPTTFGGDLNQLAGATFVYTQPANTTNVPAAGGDPYLVLQNGPVNSGNQLALRNGEAWLRGQNSGAWGSWNKLWTTANLDPNVLLLKTDIAQAAAKLSVARNFSISGVVSATGVGFDGTGNVVLSTSMADNALTIAKTSGLQAALNTKFELRGLIAATTSLNSLTTSGVYYQNVASEATTANRYPVANGLGVLTVWTQGGYTVQEYRVLPNTSYLRTYDGTTWSTWSKGLTSNDFDPATKYDKTGGTIDGNVILSGTYNLRAGGRVTGMHFSTTRGPGSTGSWSYEIYKNTSTIEANLRGGLWQGVSSVSLANATDGNWHELKITDDGFLKFKDGDVYHAGNFTPNAPVPSTGLLHVGDPASTHLRLRSDGRYSVNGGTTWREFNEIPQAVTDPQYTTVSIGADNDIVLYESSAGDLTVRSGSSTAFKYFNFRANGNFEVPDGRVLIGTYEAWHAGNFNPANKLDTTGTAASATRLATARTINGVSFDGTANITVGAAITTATAGDLTTRHANGFYEKNNPTVGTGYPEEGSTGWWHIHAHTHTNTGNNFSYQQAVHFDDVAKSYVRQTSNNGQATWYLNWNAKNLPNPLSRDGGTMLGSLMSHSLGFATPASNTPLITKAHTPFTSGAYNGLGRWGVFMEAGVMGFGLPQEYGASAAKIFMYNANSTIAATHTIWNSGNLTPFDVTVGANVRGRTNHFVGAVNTQQVLRGMGRNNDVTRWSEVIESDNSYALYDYDSAGGTVHRALNIRTPNTAGAGASTASLGVRSLYVTEGGNGEGSLFLGDSGYYLYMHGSQAGLYHGTNGSAWYWTYATRLFGVNGTLGATRVYSGWDAGTDGAISCSNWFRTSGDTGVFFSSHGGGVHMTEANYVRTYNNKAFAATGFQNYKTDWTPNAAATSAAYRADGSYGGGYGLIDGSYQITLYSVSGHLNFGFGVNATASRASLQSDGTFYAKDYAISSDKSLKTNIKPMTFRGPLEPSTFDWIDGMWSDIGFIADDVEKLYPEAVEFDPLTGKRRLKQNKLIAVVSAQANMNSDDIESLKEELQTANEKLATMQGELERLKQLVDQLINQ